MRNIYIYIYYFFVRSCVEVFSCVILLSLCFFPSCFSAIFFFWICVNLWRKIGLSLKLCSCLFSLLVLHDSLVFFCFCFFFVLSLCFLNVVLIK